MENKYNWNLKDIYQTEDDFEKSRKIIENKLEEIKKYKGKLSKNSNNIYNCYRLYEEILEEYEKFYSYGMLSYHLNMADSKNIKLFKMAEGIGTEIEKETSFITPEITKIENETIQDFINDNSKLQRYKRILEEIMKNKKHILCFCFHNLINNCFKGFL